MKHAAVVDIRNVPTSQNRVYASPEAALHCPRGDIILVPHPRMGFLHNEAFDPSLVAYDADYQNDASLSHVYQTHLVTIADLIKRHSEIRNVYEIGCGKAAFLHLLASRGYSVGGCDPAYEGNLPSIARQAFQPRQSIDAECIVLRHFLEYTTDPVAFLSEVASVSTQQAIIYIETPNLEFILGGRGWLNINYEYVFYYRQNDLAQLFDEVIEQGECFGGEYVYIFARLNSLRLPDPSTIASVPSIPFSITECTRALLARIHGNTKAIWGAAGKGSMFAHHAKSQGTPIDFAIDISPAKQNRYLPGTALPILSPSLGLGKLKGDDTIIIMNSQYAQEVRHLSGYRHTYLEA